MVAAASPYSALVNCPSCKGKGVQHISVTEVDGLTKEPRKSSVTIDCITCKGKCKVTLAEKLRMEQERNLWCSCKEPGEGVFHDDNTSQVCRKHHWTCSRCGKILQVG